MERAEIERIARECASFAQDNAGVPCFTGQHTPLLIWLAWNDKEGSELPMPSAFVKCYVDALYAIGGDDLVAEVLCGGVYV